MDAAPTTRPVATTRRDMTFPTEVRRALAEYPCTLCGKPITAGSYYHRRLRRQNGQMVATKYHGACLVKTWPKPPDLAVPPPPRPYQPHRPAKEGKAGPQPWQLILLAVVWAIIALAALKLGWLS